MNIDFIKWLCEKAEGFLFRLGANKHSFITTPSRALFNLSTFDETHARYEKWVEEHYPLLLQRAIEGVNREHFKHSTRLLPIMIDKLGVHIHSQWLGVSMDWGSSPNIDKAKESALKYIWEQENNNEM